MAASSRRRTAGQALVEVLLILPVFLTLVFTIMEVGHLCFWVIVLNHATFEAARTASLDAFPPVPSACDPSGSCAFTAPDPGRIDNAMTTIMNKFIITRDTWCTATPRPTLFDPQGMITNYELVADCSYCVRFVFPTSFFVPRFSNCPGGRLVSSSILMPIEQPVPQ
jgi:hypothetical protein